MARFRTGVVIKATVLCGFLLFSCVALFSRHISGRRVTILPNKYDGFNVTKLWTTEEVVTPEVSGDYVIDFDPKMVNPHNFTYVLNEPDLCTRLKRDVFLLVFVHSAPDHFQHRKIIRKTWANSRLYRKLRTVTVFVLGLSLDPKIQGAIRVESERYRDVIQEDFIDAYRNTSYKVVAGFRWVTRFCRRARFVLKSDDDMFVNVFDLVRSLRAVSRFDVTDGRDKIMCCLWNTEVQRDKKLKGFVSREEYPGDRYPPFCSGSAYVMPTPLVPVLYNASLHTPFFWVDDVWASGVLAQAAKIGHWDIRSLYVFNEKEFDEKLAGNAASGAIFAHMTGPNGHKNRLLYWDKIAKTNADFSTDWNVT